MKRILLVTEVFPPLAGGSGRWLWELYRRLPLDRVVVAAGLHAEQEAFDRSQNLWVRRLPLRFPSWGLLGYRPLRDYHRTYRTLKAMIVEHAVETLHCGKCLPEGLLAWVLKVRLGLPYTCYVHGEELSIAAASRELRWWARRALRGARFLIANSHNTAGLLRTDWGLDPRRVRVLHPGVDTDYFRPADPSAAERGRLGWNGRRVVLTVGRLQRRKGQDMLIRALPVIRRVVPDVLYAVVGDGEDRPYLEGLARELGVGGQVQFLGNVPDGLSRTCYQQCDLFALPNRRVGADFEGFGMVLVEAQACGKPVLAGSSGGTAETMDVGRTGVVVNCDAPGPLAAAVDELLLSPERRSAMGSAARDWAVRQFDWDVLTRQASELFATVSPHATGPRPCPVTPLIR
jgi:phosphatidylinositol alpha-1,6-mannosyltransferase